MNRSKNPFAILADHAAHGDPNAKSQLRQELEPEMVHIVRQTLRAGLANTPMKRRILAEARRLAEDATPVSSADRELLIRKVARNLCFSVAAHLRPRLEDDHMTAETVVSERRPAKRQPCI